MTEIVYAMFDLLKVIKSDTCECFCPPPAIKVSLFLVKEVLLLHTNERQGEFSWAQQAVTQAHATLGNALHVMPCACAVVWACALVCHERLANPSCTNPSQLSFLVRGQKALINSIVFSCTMLLVHVCLSTTGRRKFQMAAGKQLKEGARSSCLEHDYCPLFPLVLWDYAHLAPATVLNIYLMPLQS